MSYNLCNAKYETPELSVVAVAVDAGFSLSDSTLENIWGENEEIEW